MLKDRASIPRIGEVEPADGALLEPLGPAPAAEEAAPAAEEAAPARLRGEPAQAPPPGPEIVPDAHPGRLPVSTQEPPTEASAPSPARLQRPAAMALLSILIVLVSTGGSFLYSVTRPPVYGARVEILFEPDRGGTLSEDRQIATQVAFLRSRAVLEPVAAELGGGDRTRGLAPPDASVLPPDAPAPLTVEDLERILKVEVIPKSTIFRLTVADRDPARALDLVRRVGLQYVGAFVTRADEVGPSQSKMTELTNQQRSVDQRLAELEAQRQSGAARGQVINPDDERKLLVDALNLRARLLELQENLGAVRLDEARATRADLLSDAYVLPRPMKPKPAQAALAGALVGTVIAALMAGALVRARSLTATS